MVFNLKKSCEDGTESSHIPLTQDSLMLMSYITLEYITLRSTKLHTLFKFHVFSC